MHRADKNSNNIRYNNNNIIMTILWYIENPGIVRLVYSGIFRHIQGLIQVCSCILKDIKAYSGVVEAYGAIIRHI